MTNNVFGGTLSLTQSINLSFSYNDKCINQSINIRLISK